MKYFERLYRTIVICLVLTSPIVIPLVLIEKGIVWYYNWINHMAGMIFGMYVEEIIKKGVEEEKKNK